MSMSTSSSVSSLRSQTASITTQSSMSIDSSSSHSGGRVAGSTPSLTIGGTQSSGIVPLHMANERTSTSVPVWRSVGEKSALRGYLSVLGVTPEASLADIRGAYKVLALQWHPDRSDAPNARMKFQELSQAYMALCVTVEEGDAQEIDAGLYETETHATCEDISYLGGMAGVTSGLAGVYCGIMPGGGVTNNNCGSYNAQYKDLHLDLYRNGGIKPKHQPPHSLTCTCHTHMQLQPQFMTQQVGCMCNTTGDCKLHDYHMTNSYQQQHDLQSAVNADVSLLTGVLAPPMIAVGDTSVQVRIAPLPTSPTCVYQIQMKIKRNNKNKKGSGSYQLVYQGPELTYTVPNLLPGTQYSFRVRACPRAGSVDSDEDEEIPSNEAEAETEESVSFSQPTTITTQGNKPEGNTSHPPVLSNLQLAAAKKKAEKESKSAAKKKPQQKSTNTPPNEQEVTTSTTATPATKPAPAKSPPSAIDTSSGTLTASNSSTTLSTSSAGTTAPSTPSAASTTSSNSNPAPSSTASSKKAEKLRQKQLEEEKKKAEQAKIAEKQIAEEVAYQKFLMEKREEAERIRLAEEQAELERYAKLKEEQDQKRKSAEVAAAKNKQQQQRNNKKNAKENGAVAKEAATQEAATPSKEPLLPTPPTSGRGKKAPTSPPKSKTVEPATAAIMHIKLTPEQQAAIKSQSTTTATTKTAEPLLPMPTPEKPAVVTKQQQPSSKKPPTAATPAAVATPVATTPAKVSAWATATPATAVVAPIVKGVPSTPTLPPANNSSPIIRSKPASGKAWDSTPMPAAALTTPVSAPMTHQQHSMPIQPFALTPSATAIPPTDSLLAEHLNRFDSTKPWHADLLTQHSLHSTPQQQQQSSSHASHYQSLDSSRFQHLSSAATSFTPSHGLPPTLPTVAPSSHWNEDDLLLSDLQHELERERWNNASHHAATNSTNAVEAAWNNTANTTLSSHSLIHTHPTSSLNPSSLHFTPLSSLLSDYSDSNSFSNSTHATDYDSTFSNTSRSSSNEFDVQQDQIFLPTPVRSSSNLSSSAGFFDAPSSSPSIPSYSSLNQFPTTGLSRNAPTFVSMSAAASTTPTHSNGASSMAGESLLSSHQSGSMGAHTRLPLSATHPPAGPAALSSTNGSTAAPALNGIFNSFALPSFSSYSSFGAPAGTNSSLSTDWSTPATQHNLNASTSSTLSHASLHDDSDADLFNSITNELGAPSEWNDQEDAIILSQNSLRPPKW